MELKGQILKLRKTEIKNKVEERLQEFADVKSKSTRRWFSELCFCILTANSKARTAIAIQGKLGAKGFCTASAADVRQCIIDNKHRFHNNKTKYIVEARKHIDIKKKLMKFETEKEMREWIVENVKGIGYKEASHFLRNIGFNNLAILDRHILNLMVENGMMDKKPASLNRKTYIEAEGTLLKFANSLKMSQAELDLYMWYLKGGDVLK